MSNKSPVMVMLWLSVRGLGGKEDLLPNSEGGDCCSSSDCCGPRDTAGPNEAPLAPRSKASKSWLLLLPCFCVANLVEEQNNSFHDRQLLNRLRIFARRMLHLLIRLARRGEACDISNAAASSAVLGGVGGRRFLPAAAMPPPPPAATVDENGLLLVAREVLANLADSLATEGLPPPRGVARGVVPPPSGPVGLSGWEGGR